MESCVWENGVPFRMTYEEDVWIGEIPGTGVITHGDNFPDMLYMVLDAAYLMADTYENPFEGSNSTIEDKEYKILIKGIDFVERLCNDLVYNFQPGINMEGNNFMKRREIPSYYGKSPDNLNTWQIDLKG